MCVRACVCRVWIVHSHNKIFYLESAAIHSQKNGKWFLILPLCTIPRVHTISAQNAIASKRAAPNPNPNPSPYGLRKSTLTGRCIWVVRAYRLLRIPHKPRACWYRWLGAKHEAYIYLSIPGLTILSRTFKKKVCRKKNTTVNNRSCSSNAHWSPRHRETKVFNTKRNKLVNPCKNWLTLVASLMLIPCWVILPLSTLCDLASRSR